MRHHFFNLRRVDHIVMEQQVDVYSMTLIQQKVDVAGSILSLLVAAIKILDIAVLLDDGLQCLMHALISAVIADQNLDIRIGLRCRALSSASQQNFG